MLHNSFTSSVGHASFTVRTFASCVAVWSLQLRHFQISNAVLKVCFRLSEQIL